MKPLYMFLLYMVGMQLNAWKCIETSNTMNIVRAVSASRGAALAGWGRALALRLPVQYNSHRSSSTGEKRVYDDPDAWSAMPLREMH